MLTFNCFSNNIITAVSIPTETWKVEVGNAGLGLG
jgi:hypothetical protein